jgi:hypothetical protein
VLTSVSLAAVRARRPDAVIDVRRFRPNIVVETVPEITGPVEHGWEGRHLQVGSVKLELTWRPKVLDDHHAVDDDVPRDRSLMRTIVRDFGHELGIYARIVTPGTITLHDQVTLR